MGFLKSKKNDATDINGCEQKLAATFWDAPITTPTQASLGERQKSGDQTVRVDESAALQTDLRTASSSRDYLQQPLNASVANDQQPTSRPHIPNGRMTKDKVLAGDNRMMLSTHRAALIDPQQVEAERAAKRNAQENRAWHSFTAMLELFAR